jgi:hypothetical protein
MKLKFLNRLVILVIGGLLVLSVALAFTPFSEQTSNLNQNANINILSIQSAIDNNCIGVVTQGPQWFEQFSTYYHDNDAAQSGSISDDEFSLFYISFSGAGNISFYWKVSSESGHDFLWLWIDGVPKVSISGDTDWTYVSFVVNESGVHTFKWEYIKDVISSAGSDCGWVDWVIWTSGSEDLTLSPLPSMETGNTYDISWSSTGSVSFVNIQLLDSSYHLVTTLYTYEPNNGIVYWNPSRSLPSGNYCLYIEDYCDGYPYDYSSIFSITLTSVNIPSFDFILLFEILIVSLSLIFLKRLMKEKL